MQVTKTGGFEAFESSDRKHLYYVKGGGVRGIWKVPVEGGEETQVFEGGHMGSWAITDRGIFVLSPYLKPPMQIDFFDFESNRVAPVLQLPPQVRLAPSSPTLAASRDGEWLVFVQYDQWGSDIHMLEGSW